MKQPFNHPVPRLGAPTTTTFSPGPALDDHFLQRVRSLAPSGTNLPNSPSIRQCVGTNRLWGAHLGVSLADDLESKGPERQALIDIAVFSRAILVLDDYLDDEFLQPQERAATSHWISRLEEELQSAYACLDEDFCQHSALRLRSKLETSRRESAKTTLTIYESSIEKCLILFNPYRLRCAKRARNHPARVKFLENFFFTCQLLDDFQDLFEDGEKRLNHNIFLAGLPALTQSKIYTHRLNWLRPLLEVVKGNLRKPDVTAGAANSQVLSYYYLSSLLYLNELLQAIPAGNGRADQGRCEFQQWAFEPLAVLGEAAPARLEPLIRPEILQTYAMGLRKIEEV